MNPERFARAKALFLEARGLEAQRRADFLSGACSGDAELRREVEGLLAHDDPRTILQPARGSSGRAPGGVLAGRGARGRWWRRAELPVAGALVLLVVVGWWARERVGAALQGVVAGMLETVLAADVEALRRWIEVEQGAARAWAAGPELRAGAVELLELARSGAEEDVRPRLLAAPALARLRDALDPLLLDRRHRAWGLVDPAGRILATSRPQQGDEVVGAAVVPDGLALVARVLQGETIVKMPYRLGSLARVEQEVDEGSVLSVLAPVFDENGRALAALGLLLEPDEDFTRILSLARIGESGETYAFDRRGFLLSHSRFEADLERLGLVPPGSGGAMLSLRLADPGGDLTAGHRPERPLDELPLTRATLSAVAGRDGVDAMGYRDYRGVPVVGAWRWLDDLEMGVVTEVDAGEAYAPVAYLRAAFWVLGGALAATVLALLGASLLLGRLRRRTRRLGQYTLLRPIGEGGMGVVWEARHAMLARPTAIKLVRGDRVDAESLARFEREVQYTASLTHPNTVSIFDYGRSEDGVFYYAMERLDGLTLREVVRRWGALAPERVVHVLRQVCGSLAEAHERGLVHRDVKPSNVMLCRLGGLHDVVKVLDFGLVREANVRAEERLTAPGVVGGTPGYVAPEVLREGGRADARSDLFALGALAFFLLTGEEAFGSGSASEIVARVLAGPTPTLSARALVVPPGLQALAGELLASDPAKRPPSARAVIARLDTPQGLPPWSDERARDWWADRQP